MSDMNSNASLYNKTLSYRSNSAPYQCLAQPWFVHVPKPVYYPRYRCSIEPLICGEVVFRRIKQDLEKAQDSVDIITWGFDPGMVLVRGSTAEDGERYGDLLIRISTRKKNPVKVRLVVWHDDIAAHLQMKNNPGFYGTMFPSIDGLVTSYYSEIHQDYNAEWYANVCAGKYQNIHFHVRNVPSRFLSAALKNESSPDNVDSIVAKSYLSHHQKMLLIDYELPEFAIGYVMGHNSITDFWDTKEHKFRDPRRERFYKMDHAKFQKELWERTHDVELFNYQITGMQLRETESIIQENSCVPVYSRGENGKILPLEFKATSNNSIFRMTDAQNRQKKRITKEYTDKYSYVTKPYQDVSSRVRGPILYDLNHNFCQAWEESNPPDSLFLDTCSFVHIPPKINLCKAVKVISNQIHKEKMDPDFVARRKNFSLKEFSLVDGKHTLQLLRTQPLHQEKCIKECYANLTRQMLHYIFIQNQYLQYEPWAKHLCNCVRKLRKAGYLNPIYVFILTSTPESDGMDLPTYDVASTLGLSESMRYEHEESLRKWRALKAPRKITPKELAAQGIEVFMGSIWTCVQVERKLEPWEYEEIYIHSKVTVVDDAAFTVGSANLNLRSMALDSELNVLSDASDIAYKLRADLFSQCTNEPGPAAFSDMTATFQKWNQCGLKNRMLMDTGKLLGSQLLPFYVDREPGSPVV